MGASDDLVQPPRRPLRGGTAAEIRIGEQVKVKVFELISTPRHEAQVERRMDVRH